MPSGKSLLRLRRRPKSCDHHRRVAARALCPRRRADAGAADGFLVSSSMCAWFHFRPSRLSMRFRARTGPANCNIRWFAFKISTMARSAFSRYQERISPMNRIEHAPRGDDARGKDRPAHMVAAGPCRHRAGAGKRCEPRAFAPGGSAVSSTFGEPRRSMLFRKSRWKRARLGIPLLIGFDVLHGHKTIFPIPLAEAASFDPRLWEAQRPRGGDRGGRRRHQYDLRADARYRARSALGADRRGAGEDPWVVAQFAKAKVRGFQGMACRKAWPAPEPLPPRPSISAPMARPSPGATMPQRMSPNVFCTKSICRPSRRPWRRAAPRSCRLSTISPAFR